jgi:citrate synthase
LTQLRSCATAPLTQLQAALPIAAAADLASYDLRPAAVRQTGARIIRLLTTIVAGHDARAPVHRVLQAAWAPKSGAAADVIRTALVLCSDHELNVSTFTARCAASAGASPYDIVSAAMATLKGYKHGGARNDCLPSSKRRTHRSTPAPWWRIACAMDKACRGSATLCIQLVIPARGCSSAWRRPAGTSRRCGRFDICSRRARKLLRDAPNLDAGLAAVTRAYRLPEQAPLLLFTLGRTIGWIAHAIEEYASGQLIRPRARYIGPPP